MKLAVLAFLFLSAFDQPARAGIRALLVGIDAYPETAGPRWAQDPLKAPANDLRYMKEWLLKTMGAREEDVLVLQNAQATCSGIQKAFQSHLVQNTGPEDVVVFYFAGHGSQVPDLGPDLDELDGQDEILVTHDFLENNADTWLTDDILHRHLLACPAGHLLVMFDSCHAGTATRGIRGAGSSFQWNTRSAAPPDTSLREKTSPPHHLFFAACGDAEVARQITLPDTSEPVGLFTHTFLKLAAEPEFGLPLDDFIKRLDQDISRTSLEEINSKLDQHPRLESSRRDFSLEAFLKGQVFELATTPPPQPPVTAPISGFEPSGKVQVDLSTDKESYLWTEAITVKVKMDRAAYVRLFHVDSAGTVIQVYPNPIQPLRLIPPDETLVLPPPSPVSGRQYALRVTPPSQGMEAFIAVASTHEFTDLEAREFATGGFNSLPGLQPADVLTRGIVVEARPGSFSPGTPPLEAVAQTYGQALRIFRTSEK